MRLYVALSLIALIGFVTILSLSIGLYLIASHSLKIRLIGIFLLILGVALIGVWKRAVSYFGSRWSCF